jgi:hypothetical protein
MLWFGRAQEGDTAMSDDGEEIDGAEDGADEQPEGGITEKTLAERAKEIGRDGSYLEVDANGLVAACRSGELQKAKIVVIRAARIELSDPEDVNALGKLMQHIMTCLAGVEGKTFDVTGMDDEQASFYAVRKMLSNGLRGMPK